MESKARSVARCLGAVVAMAAVVLGTQVPGHGAAPSAPTGLAATDDNPPTLSWERVSGAVRYEVQVDGDDAFGTPDYSVTTVNTQAVPTALLKAGDVYWRVRSVDAANAAGSWSPPQTFSVQAVPEPTGLAPDGVSLAQPNDPPLLSWTAVQGATSYLVQVDAGTAGTVDFVGGKEYSTQVTSLVVPDALPAADDGTTYSWHVKAIRASGIESLYSATAEFTLVPLQGVTLTSPDNNAVVQDVVLDWEPLPGAQYYQLQVSTDDSFSLSTLVDDKTKVHGTQYSPETTYDNNTYFWRVRAVDASGNPSAWSDQTEGGGNNPRSFVRAWPQTPTLVHPADNGTPGAGLHLEWTPVEHASHYEVQMGTDPNFSPGTTDNCQVAGTTYTPGMFQINEITGPVNRSKMHEMCRPAAGVKTYWRVRPLDLPYTKVGTGTNGVQGLYSPTRSFTFSPQSFGTVTPSNGATVDVPTLSWDPVDWAESYKVTVRDVNGSAIVFNKTTYATTYTPVASTPLTAAKSPYTWQITAYGADGKARSLAQTRTFSISDAQPTTGPWAGDAAPLSPLTANGIEGPTLRAPMMAWEPYPGADHYEVVAGPADGDPDMVSSFANDLDVFGAEVNHPSVTDTEPQLLAPGDYEWRVRAKNASNATLAEGPEATFSIAQLDAVTGIEFALDGTTIDEGAGSDGDLDCTPQSCTDAPATPVISWNPVEGAGSYLVYVSEEASFTNIVEPRTSLPATSNTTWAPSMSVEKSALAESLAGGSYFVFIRPCKQGATCGPTPISSTGMALGKFRKKSPPLQLESPGDGATIDTTEISFDWRDYRPTNADHTWGETGEAGTQSAQRYRIVIDDNANFSSPIESVRVDQSTYTSAAKLYPEGTLYWRVQGIDVDNNDLSWSATRTVLKASKVPTLSAPADDSTNAGTTTFRWEAQPFAASYDIELYANDDTSQVNRVFAKNVKQTAYVWNELIPPSGVAYVWRVRRVDALGNKSDWSALRRFTSEGATPTIEGPTDGAYVEGDDVLLAWSEVTGATSYDVKLVNPGGSVSEQATTRATAYAPTRALADGLWTWRVTAKNASGDALHPGPVESTFRVDEVGPRVTASKPAGSAKPGSVFVVKFNEPVKNVTTISFFLKKDGSRTKVPATVTLSADGLTGRLVPDNPLRKGTRYDAKVTKKVTDLRDNPLTQAYTWAVFVS